MSNSDVHPGTTETQQMRVIAPPGVRILLPFDTNRSLIFSISRTYGYGYVYHIPLPVKRCRTR